MSDGYLEVKNWKEFQHYKDRDPLWIKLYRKLLTDYAFSRLQDASRSHLMLIWLVASESEGRIPNDPAWVQNRIAATTPVDLNVLVDAGFLALERRKQPASERRAKSLPRDRDRERRSVDERRTTWLTPFADIWAAKCGSPPFGKLAKALQPLITPHGEPEVLNRWRRYVEGTEPRFASAYRFAETFNSWDEPDTQQMTDDFGVMRLHRKDRESGQWVVAS